MALLVRVVNRYIVSPRRGASLTAYDLAVGQNDRWHADAQLATELGDSIRSANDSVGRNLSIELGETQELRGVSLLTLSIMAERADFLLTTVSDDQLVSVGPVSLRLGRLLRHAIRFFDRPCEQQLALWLHSEEGKVRIRLELRTGATGIRVGRERRVHVWSIFHEGGRARELAIADVGIYAGILLAYREGSRPDWRSVRDYRLGRQVIERASDLSQFDALSMKSAIPLFESSLHYDPTDHLARFELAAVLQRDGQWADAASHLRLIEEALAVPRGRNGHDSIGLTIPETASFRLAVRYNIAVALSMHKGIAIARQSVGILDGLIDELGQDGSYEAALSSGARQRLSLLMRGARAAARIKVQQREARIAAARGGQKAHDWDMKGRASTLQLIMRDHQWIMSLAQEAEILDWRAYAQARAECDNALGVAHSRVGHAQRAEDLYRSAMTIWPGFPDPYINLADIVLKSKNRFERLEGARDLLERAVKLRPGDRRAYRLLGNVLALTPNAQHLAIEALTRADDPWSLYRAADIEYFSAEPDYTRVHSLLERSLLLDNSVDVRSRKYVQSILRLDEIGRADRGKIRHALRVAEDLSSKSSRPADREAGKHLANQLRGVLSPGQAERIDSPTRDNG